MKGLGTFSRCVFAALVFLGTQFVFGASAALPVLLPRVAKPLSETADGISGGASATGDGRYVVFLSSADNILASMERTAKTQVYLRDRQNGSVQLISVSTNGLPGNGDSTYASISADGKVVVFQSDSSNLAAGDTNGWSDVFLRDIAAGTTVMVTAPGNSVSRKPFLSVDGKRVIFESYSTNLVNVSDLNRDTDIFMADFSGAAASTILATRNRQGTAASNRGSTILDVSADGARVLFSSTATDLSSTAVTTEQYWVYDSAARTNILVSQGTAGPKTYALQTGVLAMMGPRLFLWGISG
jgi:Tol biopolymer transport system component